MLDESLQRVNIPAAADIVSRMAAISRAFEIESQNEARKQKQRDAFDKKFQAGTRQYPLKCAVPCLSDFASFI